MEMTQDHVQLQALVLMLLNVWGYATTLLVIQCLMTSKWKKKSGCYSIPARALYDFLHRGCVQNLKIIPIHGVFKKYRTLFFPA
jgi:hypothetical protein